MSALIPELIKISDAKTKLKPEKIPKTRNIKGRKLNIYKSKKTCTLIEHLEL